MEKLIAILVFLQRAHGRRLVRQLLPNIIVAMVLIIMIAIMASAMLIGGLIAAYYALVGNGIEPYYAIIITALLTIFTLITLVFLTCTCLQRLRQIPQTLLGRSPLTSHITDTMDAFIEGLMTDPK